MRPLLLTTFLLIINGLNSQTITPGKYGPNRSAFWGTLLTFKEHNEIEVQYYSCTEQKFGIGFYDLKDSIVFVRFTSHPGDTLAPISSISYSEIEKTDSINVSYRLFDWKHSVWIYDYTINDSVYIGWKVTDTTRTLHFKIPVSELPCTIKVSSPNYDNIAVYITNPFDCDIITHATSLYQWVLFYHANESIKFHVENITKNSFDIFHYTSEGKKAYTLTKREE